MKCYQVFDQSQYAGIPIIDSSEPFLCVTAGTWRDGTNVPLAPDLVKLFNDEERRKTFSESYPKLVACDVEKRGVVWATKETKETEGDVLVLVKHSLDVELLEKVSLSFTYSELGCDVLVATTKTADYNSSLSGRRRHIGEAALVRLSENGCIRVTQTVMKPRSVMSVMRLRAPFIVTTHQYEISAIAGGGLIVRGLSSPRDGVLADD